MEPGLKIIKFPGTYYRGVTRVGWLRHRRGDWWELVNARTITRTNNDLTPLDRLASHGPTENHRLTAVSQAIEDVNSFMPRRIIRADPAAWPQCPKPADWVDE